VQPIDLNNYIKISKQLPLQTHHPGDKPSYKNSYDATVDNQDEGFVNVDFDDSVFIVAQSEQNANFERLI
jgi:hypothetical protein